VSCLKARVILQLSNYRLQDLKSINTQEPCNIPEQDSDEHATQRVLANTQEPHIIPEHDSAKCATQRVPEVNAVAAKDRLQDAPDSEELGKYMIQQHYWRRNQLSKWARE